MLFRSDSVLSPQTLESANPINLMETYIGTAVFVDEEPYGILSFLSFSRGQSPRFSSDEIRFIQLMAQWIGFELMRVKHLSEIHRQQKSLIYSSKMAALGEMAGGVAHEINNPLAMISGRSQILRSMTEGKDISEQELLRGLDKIDVTVTRIVKVIKGLREFSRDADADEFLCNNVHQIVQDTLELCRVRFRNEGIALTIAPFDVELCMECRAVQVSQVLLNLLNNAADAINKSSKKWVELSCVDLGGLLQFRVKDSGLGIPLAIRNKIMQPFFTTKGPGKGTGLGLSVSLGLVASHGGRLEYDDTEKNTCFFAEFPKFQNPLRGAS
mgnify:CR=1 FL=1